MTTYTYHASHEQFPPAELLRLAAQAEAVGFDGVFCSDHLQPWSPSQGHSGHAWAWLGAAMQATGRVRFGTITVPCGWRYHPAVLAQAIGTLGQMFPGRLPWVAFGSGEALNEQVLGAGWPPKAERNQRLREGVGIVRELLAGEKVRHRGHLMVDGARVWDRAAAPPRLVGAALSEATAYWLGDWADGLLTVGRDLAFLERMVAAFRRGGGEGKPVHVKLDVSWVPGDAAKALEEAHRHWRFNTLGPDINAVLRQPEDFDAATRLSQPEDMHEHVLVTGDLRDVADHLRRCAALGADSVDIHQVGLSHQREFIDACGREVLAVLGR